MSHRSTLLNVGNHRRMRPAKGHFYEPYIHSKNSLQTGQSRDDRYINSLCTGSRTFSTPSESDQSLEAITAALRYSSFSLQSVIEHKSARVYVGRQRGIRLYILDWCGCYSDRAEILSCIKDSWPSGRLIAIQHHSENPFTGTDLTIAGDFSLEQDG